jgi:hypothetical protein
MQNTPVVGKLLPWEVPFREEVSQPYIQLLLLKGSLLFSYLTKNISATQTKSLLLCA